MSGHGHVVPNADGSKARCGGPAICSECALEAARLNSPTPPAASAADQKPSPEMFAIGDDMLDEIERAGHDERAKQNAVHDAFRKVTVALTAQLALAEAADAEECEFCGGSGKAPPQETASAVEGDYGCQSCGRPMGYKTMGTAAICQICCEERVGAGTEGLAVRKPELTTQPLVNETRLSPNDVAIVDDERQHFKLSQAYAEWIRDLKATVRSLTAQLARAEAEKAEYVLAFAKRGALLTEAERKLREAEEEIRRLEGIITGLCEQVDSLTARRTP